VKIKSDIPLICRKLSQAGLIVAFEGNISERKGDNILITPSQVNKSDVQARDLCLINKKGETVYKNSSHQASSEKFMHLAIYEVQKKASVIIHAHPPSAIALSLARPKWKVLPPYLPEVLVTLGEVPFVPYTCPGTKQLGKVIKNFVKKSKALILSRHGALVWAEDLLTAFSFMELLEACCKVITLGEAMGKIKPLTQKELRTLSKLK